MVSASQAVRLRPEYSLLVALFRLAFVFFQNLYFALSNMPRVPTQYGNPGEVFARGLRGGVFSWSYYGTSDGIEANTKDTYTEHVMRIQWGKTADTMTSWMVARRYVGLSPTG